VKGVHRSSISFVVAALLVTSACKHQGPDDKPVERAVIDVPTQPSANANGPKVIEPARKTPVGDGDLAHEVTETLNGFTKQSNCPDFDYFPDGGYSNFWCHRPQALTIQAISARAGVPIFLSGPHPSFGFTNTSNTDFGHYNPAFVRWLADEVAPRGRDSASVQATQPMYDSMMKPLATIFHHVSRKIRAEPRCFERERDGYSRLLAQKKLPAGYYERWFFFMNPEWCPRAAKNLNGNDQYYYNHGMDGGVDGNVTKTVLAFFIRRSLDGTLPEFERALDKLIAAYEPDLLAAP